MGGQETEQDRGAAGIPPEGLTAHDFAMRQTVGEGLYGEEGWYMYATRHDLLALDLERTAMARRSPSVIEGDIITSPHGETIFRPIFDSNGQHIGRLGREADLGESFKIFLERYGEGSEARRVQEVGDVTDSATALSANGSEKTVFDPEMHDPNFEMFGDLPEEISDGVTSDALTLGATFEDLFPEQLANIRRSEMRIRPHLLKMDYGKNKHGEDTKQTTMGAGHKELTTIVEETIRGRDIANSPASALGARAERVFAFIDNFEIDLMPKIVSGLSRAAGKLKGIKQRRGSGGGSERSGNVVVDAVPIRPELSPVNNAEEASLDLNGDGSGVDDVFSEKD